MVVHVAHRGRVATTPSTAAADRPTTAATQVLLDENLEAEGQDFFSVDAFDVSPDQQLLAWSADVDGGEKYTLRDPRPRHRPRHCRRRPRHRVVRHRLVARRRSLCSTSRANEAMRPFRVWRHDLGTTQADDTSGVRGDRRALLRRRRPEPQRSSGSSSTVVARRSREVLLIPADDPKQRPHGRSRHAPTTSSTPSITGATVRDPHQPRRRGLPRDDGTDRRAGRRGPNSSATTSRAGGSSAIEPFAGHLVLHEWQRRPAAPAGAVRRGRRARLRSRRRAARGRARRQPRVGQPPRSATATSRSPRR